MKNTIITKKIKLFPIGDEIEVNRVYNYIRDGQYTQYQAMNLLMSQVGSVYFLHHRDIKSVEFKEEFRSIFKSDNPIFNDFTFPTGADLKASVLRAVQNDFSVSLKNGLAKGDRTLPTYKRGMPMFVTGRSLNISCQEQEGHDVYKISWVNKIQFKVITGTQGKNNWYLIDLLHKLANNDDNYKICGSKIGIQGKYIYLYLTVQKEVDTDYVPISGRTMGVSFGYDKPLSCAFSDNDTHKEIQPDIDYISKRQQIQRQFSRLQQSLTKCKGGRGRKHKLAALEKLKNKEKNFVSYYNHLLSRAVVDYAVQMQAECIVLEKIQRRDLIKHPILLRNWSYFQLANNIEYKAKQYGIEVLNDTCENICCCQCGQILEKENVLPPEIEWTCSLSFTCSACQQSIDYSYNKAKNLSMPA